MKELKLKFRSLLLLCVVFLLCSAFKEVEVFSGPTTNKVDKLTSPVREILTEEEIRTELISLGSKYLGRNYHSGGKSPNTGFDCSGFTGYLLGNFDIYVSSSSHSQIFDGKHKPLSKVEPGDLVFFSRTPKGRIFHVAMVKENTEDGIIVIHSTCSNGVIETNISKDEYWAPKIVEARDVVTE
jgi:peptidoglycan endopeptidase LytE